MAILRILCVNGIQGFCVLSSAETVAVSETVEHCVDSGNIILSVSNKF